MENIKIMIKLSEAEKKFIKFCKGQYTDIYSYRNSWVISFKPLFKEIYGWDPKEYPHDYTRVLFNKLFEIHMKIADDQSGSHNELLSIFYAAFHKSILRPQKKPIERAISQLCGLIQNNAVLDDNKNKRYEL